MEYVLLMEIAHGGAQLLSILQYLTLRHFTTVQYIQQTPGDVLLEGGGEGGREGGGGRGKGGSYESRATKLLKHHAHSIIIRVQEKNFKY